MSSLRARLAMALMATILPLIAIVGVALHVFVSGSLLARFDDGLAARAQSLINATKREEGRVEFDAAADGLPQYFELRELHEGMPGAVIARSRSSGSLPLEALSRASNATRDGIADTALPGGEPGRALTLRFGAREDREGEIDPIDGRELSVAPSEPDVVVMVAQSRRDLDATIRAFDLAIICGGALLVFGVVAAVSVTLRRGLLPVSSLAEEVKRVDAATLSARVGESALPVELRPIAARINDLLDRLRDVVARERRLAASAAHELRTPIAEICAVAELALSRERGHDEYRRALSNVLESARRMDVSIEAVLRLARIASGREQPTFERIALREAVGEAWNRAMGSAIKRGVRARMDIDPAIRVRCDPTLVRLIADNLLANAAEYTADSGEVLSVATREGSIIEWRLTNTVGDGPSAHDSDGPVHLGVGLPLVAAAATAIGARFSWARQGDRFVAKLYLADGAAG
ncbi:MAG: histidine kinase dimerization/phospho-acceptor domain-containing protein [Phycisphaerales bacterium]